jgi:hypothetical protein
MATYVYAFLGGLSAGLFVGRVWPLFADGVLCVIAAVLLSRGLILMCQEAGQ